MATSADMARIHDDGTVSFTHVSGDGYLSGLGAILFMRYTTPEALDALFAGDHIEEMLDDPSELAFMDDERDPTWPWDVETADYVFTNGAWWWRNFEDADRPPLQLMTREAIIKDAVEYGSEDRVTAFLDGRGDLW